MAVRITLTKAQSATSTGAELLGLLGEIAADGQVSDEEVERLRDWLKEARAASLPESELPAVGFLADIVERVLLDGRVDPHERRALHDGIERVMPKLIREQAQVARTAAEEAELLRERFGFPVVGLNYEGRIGLIEGHGVDEGTPVFLRRDRANRFSRNAVFVLLADGTCIGMVPEERSGRRPAEEIAGLLDKGLHQLAYVVSMAGVCPIVVAYFFDPQTSRTESVPPSSLPEQNGKGTRYPAPNARPSPPRKSSTPMESVVDATVDGIDDPLVITQSRWPLVLLGLVIAAASVIWAAR